jgi:tetratricopeptide (TPR) repeat protein
MHSVRPAVRGRVALTVLLLIGVAAIAGCGGAQSRFASHMDRGKAYLAQGDYTRASLEFRNAMQIMPKDPAARLFAGHAAEKLGQFRAAAGLYQSVIDTTPDDVASRASLSRLMLLGGAPQQALDTVAPALITHPDDAALLTVRAGARSELKDDAGAAADVDRALKLAPDDADAIALRAGLYRRAGDLTRAIALVDGAVQKHPDSIDLRELLANLYLEANQPAKVEEQGRALIRVYPGEVRYRKLLALYLARAHRLDEAQRVLEDATRDLPASDDAKLTLVSFLATQRTRAQGEAILRGFIAHQPDNFALRFGLAELLMRANASAEAVAVYNDIIQRDGTGSNGLVARDRLARIVLAQGHEDAARTLIQAVLEKNPHDNDALLLRGEMALSHQDPVSAVADLRAVLRDQPDSIPVQRLLARAYLANGDRELAEQALRAAMDGDPADAAVRLELGQFLAQSGRAEQAAALLTDTVRADPDNLQVREALVRADLAAGDFAAAASAARDLETLRPDDVAGPYLAGLADQGLKRLDEAQQEFEKARAIDPKAFEPLNALARLQTARGQASQAIALVQSAIEAAGPKSAIHLNLLGEIYLANKDVARAIQTFTQATTIAPRWWSPYYNLAQARYANRDVAGAIAAYESAVGIAPTEPQPVIQLALLYESQGRIDEAIARYTELNRRVPRLPLAARDLAVLLVTYKTDRPSLDRARDLTAAFATSNNGTLLDSNGWVHFKRGEFADALPVLERAAERDPDESVIRYHLAMAQLRAGEADRARTNLQAALSGSAQHAWTADARSALARLGNPTS